MFRLYTTRGQAEYRAHAACFVDVGADARSRHRMQLRPSHGSVRSRHQSVGSPASLRRCGTTCSMPIIECVPNISEGRRAEVVEAIVSALGSVPGVTLLDYS